jgi:hypothetical protein
MPIPAFDSILNILPPHLGDPRKPEHLSPYPCTICEVCNRLCGSAERKSILMGLLGFRAELIKIGIQGFQWLGGSFLEDIESQEGRAPNDIDAITFVSQPATPAEIRQALSVNLSLLSRSFVKSTYKVDHFLVPLSCTPRDLVNQARYWCGLFSHRRDRQWKGMLCAELCAVDDGKAHSILVAAP